MKKEHIDEIQGLVVLCLGLILFVSLFSFVPEDLPWYTSQPNVPAHTLTRIVGAYLAGAMFFVFGYSAYFVAGFLLFWAWNKFSGRDLEFTTSKFVASLILFPVISGLFGMSGGDVTSLRFERAGVIGLLVSDFLITYLGRSGAYIILVTLGSMTMVLTGEFLISPLFFRVREWLHATWEHIQARWAEYREERDAAAAARAELKAKRTTIMPSKRPQVSPRVKAKAKNEEDDEDEEEYEEEYEEDEYEDDDAEEYDEEEDDDEDDEASVAGPNIRIMEKPKEKPARNVVPKRVGEWQLPSLDLLEMPPEISTSKLQSDLESGARTLESALADFGVNVRVADIERGPVITRYELEPGPGVKVNRITTLSDDIALAMKAAAVRIVAPIPGKNRVGIEVPNSSTAAVYLRDVLASTKFQSAKSKLTLALGKDIAGAPIIADLADMPHMLIAGTTGAGKTVCVNSLIMSVLFNASPEDVKFLMIDPKMVEMAQYNGIPHMLCPAVTDAKKASAVLNWAVGEMESRYQQLSKVGARNIKSYHSKGHAMPYIVVIVDELADLMQTSAKAVESAITRLAQLSRAVGIHLILATQRPSVNVITGVIKANFPARVSFKVASKVDSRTVLDMNGAESLLGKGDLLFMKPGDAKPTRGQCSFVNDEEVNRVIAFIKEQQEPEYDDAILTKQTNSAAGDSGEKDELFDEAVKLVIETNQASVSILQRRMRLGYTRAARLIDMMEQAGIVGPYCGSKPRDILVDREEWLLQNMNTEEESAAGE